MNSKDKDNLTTISQDVEDVSLPSQKQYFRHYLLHERDFLKLLHYSIKSANASAITSPTAPTTEHIVEQAHGSSPAIGGAVIPSSRVPQNLESADSASSTMNKDHSQTLTKRIRKIIRNNNLTIETRTDLINDLVASHSRKLALQAQRRLPSGNRMLLSGGGDPVRVNPSSPSTSNVPISSSATVGGIPTISPARHVDDAPSKLKESNTANSGKGISNDAENDDGDDDDDDSSDICDGDGGDNGGDDDGGDNEDEDDDDDDDDDDDGDDDNLDNDGGSSGSTGRHSLIQQLNSAIKVIKIVSRSHKIRLLPATFLALDRTVRIIRGFFSEQTHDGYESKDRRFLLKSNGDIHYQSDTKQIVVKLQKLLITLSYNTVGLFRFLQAVSKGNSGVTPYSGDEKSFIRVFVSSSGFGRKHIPCSKVRQLCM